jgi:hypothetical protein
MNVVVIVLSNYISSRNREMLTTTNERDTVITLKQKQRVVKALSRARSRLLFVLSPRSQSSLLRAAAAAVVAVHPNKALKKCKTKDRRFALFFSLYLGLQMRP